MVINRENDMELDQFYHHHIPASVGGCEIKIFNFRMVAGTCSSVITVQICHCLTLSSATCLQTQARDLMLPPGALPSQHQTIFIFIAGLCIIFLKDKY